MHSTFDDLRKISSYFLLVFAFLLPAQGLATVQMTQIMAQKSTSSQATPCHTMPMQLDTATSDCCHSKAMCGLLCAMSFSQMNAPSAFTFNFTSSAANYSVARDARFISADFALTQKPPIS